MKPTFLAVALLLLASSLSAQTRIDVGIAGGRQSYETTAQTLWGPELVLSRGRLALYYNLDQTDTTAARSIFASHFGFAYGWPIGRSLAFRLGAGPSYVTTGRLGGEPTWHAQAELAMRTGRWEWFAKVRQYDYTLEEFRTGSASPEGPALLGGIRFALQQ